MKGNPTDMPTTRYFRTFSAHRYPLQPQGQIEYSEARDLSTYYEARYDDKERLIEFVKQLRVEDDAKREWLVMFTEEYQYFDNGNLRERTLRIPGQEDQIWEFAENQKSWSNYFERLCGVWFGRSDCDDRPSPAQLSLLVHEQFTELEAEVFEAAVGVPRNRQWAVKITSEIVGRVRDVIEEIEPNAVPRICAIAEGEQGELPLSGFDEPPASLFGVVDEWGEKHSRASGLETITLLAKRDLDEMGQLWAAESHIASITFAPLRVIVGAKLATAATLFLVTSQTLNEEIVCVVNSIFRRLVRQIENVLEMTRVYEVSKRGSEWS